jgi:predicted acetyltransferase
MPIKTIDNDPRHQRELWLDEETKVSWLGVIDFTMRIGTAKVRMAGIGGVYTEREHRNQGHMRTLFEDTVTYMIDGGYDVSQLFGIPNFYNKFGYATSLPDSIFTIQTRDAEDAGDYGQAMDARPVEPNDIPEILRLYNAHNAMRTCSIVRTPDRFTEFRKGTTWNAEAEVRVWEDAQGQLAGYAVWDDEDEHVKVAEIDAWDDGLFPTILHALAEEAIARRCGEIEVHVPPDHPFAGYAQRYGIEWTITYPRDAAAMMRILNQQPLMEKLRTEFERRLAVSPMAGYTGSVALKTDLDTTVLTFDAGRLTLDERGEPDATLSLSQDQLIQCIVGYRSIRDVLNTPNVTLDGESGPLLHALFPRQHPYTWSADHY